jgi:hypothetical protein
MLLENLNGNYRNCSISETKQGNSEERENKTILKRYGTEQL